MSYHLIDVELVLSPRQLSVAGCELTNEVMATGNKNTHRHTVIYWGCFVLTEIVLPCLCQYLFSMLTVD